MREKLQTLSLVVLREFAKDKEAAYKYTIKANTVAVVSDGSAVL